MFCNFITVSFVGDILFVSTICHYKREYFCKRVLLWVSISVGQIPRSRPQGQRLGLPEILVNII